MVENHSVCPKCSFHFRITARERLELLFDGAWEEFDRGLVSSDPLQVQRHQALRRPPEGRQGRRPARLDAVVTAVGHHGRHAAPWWRAMEYGFIGGSMGVVVGEKVTRAVERALARAAAADRGVLLGRRPHDGGHAVADADGQDLGRAGPPATRRALPFLSLLTDPTTGGVTASFAMLGDLNVAEPGALIGFAGPRVIEQTIRQKLPEGFQRSEFLLEHGMLDMVVDRRELKKTLARGIRLLAG